MPVIPRASPMILLVTAMGDGYTKLGPGTSFTPGQDAIEIDGATPLAIAPQIMYAVARGMAGVRVYGYDSPAWKNQRATSPVGSGGMQQGTDPFGLGQDRWAAMSAAFNLIQRLEADLLQPQTNAIDLGPDIVTGAKQGSASNVLIAINFAESARTETVNLQPYLYANASSVERYRIIEADVFADTIAASATVQETFQPGETVVWVFRPSATVVTVKTVAAPAISPSGGTFTSSAVVTISSSVSGATIRYTLDGSDPTLNSTAYSSALTITSSMTVKAAAFSGTASGPVASAVFTIVAPGSVSSPVAYWKLDEGSGNTAVNTSNPGVSNLAVNAGWMTGSACHTGACLSFNGTDNYASTTLDLSATRAITVSFWMNWTAYADNDSLALEFGSGPYGFNSSTTGFMIDPNSSRNGAHQFEVALLGDAGYNQLLFPRPSAGVWHHYAFVLDKSVAAGNQITPYVDGTRVAYTKVTNAPNTNTFGNNNLFFMSRLGTMLFGSGMMDEVSIFNRALSAAEVQALAAQ
jgi:hypothetical protein